VKIDRAPVTTLDVDHPTKLQDFWAAFVSEVEKGTRRIVLQHAATAGGDQELAGVITLSTPAS
jgi:hypothetical protein